MNSIPFSKCIDGFFINCEARGLSKATLYDYGNSISLFQKFIQTDPLISDITSAQIEAFLRFHNSRVSKKTVLNYHVGLSALWTWAVSQKLTDTHIVREVKAPRAETHVIVPFTEHEIKLMLASVERSKPYARSGQIITDNHLDTSDRSRAILMVLIDCGLRASELCGLRFKDVDLRQRQIVLMGKGSKERIIPFSSRTGQVLWRHMSNVENQNPTAPVFTTRCGYAIDRDQLAKMLNRVSERAGVQNVHPHRFRHTFAIQYLRNGGDPYTLQMILGHSSMEMTRRYLALANSDLNAAHQRASPVDHWRL